MTPGIYQILNTKNGKSYIGSSVNVYKRLRDHRNDLRNKKHVNIKLTRAWEKYGEESFEFNVIEVVLDAPLLIACEQKWIDHYNSAKAGYNISPTAGNTLGVKHSEETKRKYSEAAKKRPPRPDVIERMVSFRRGVPMSEEHKAKIAAALKGQVIPPEVRAKLSAAAKKRVRQPMSQATRDKISKLHKGRVKSPETCAKISAAKKGKPMHPNLRKASLEYLRNQVQSEETKAKRRATLSSPEYQARVREKRRGFRHSEETKRKMSESAKRYFESKTSAVAASTTPPLSGSDRSKLKTDI